MTQRAAFLGLILLTCWSCGGSNGGNPAAPGTQSLNLTGTWTGPASDSGLTPSRIAWQVTQNNNQLAGTVNGNDTVTGILTLRNGTSTGTLTGTSLTIIWTFPIGSVVLLPNCSATINAQATISGNTMAGTYSGNNSCTGPVTNGQFTLTKQ